MQRTEHVAVREGYDRWARVYDHDGNPLVALDERVVPGLLGDVARRRVADVACETGRHTTHLADADARVTAVDFSRGMLGRARARIGGRVAFVVTDMHPAMRLRGNQAQFDDADGTEVRVEGFEHPIVDYVTAALAAGLRIECLEEHEGTEELAAAWPRARKYVGWPMLFAMRAAR
jgi:malonyl-CoA O-methyltransferase